MDWIKKMLAPSPAAIEAARERGRNEPCWCGSGMKYKKCHLREDMHKRVEERYAAQFAAQSQGGGMARPAKKGKRGRNLPPEAAPPPQ
jgi:uncharacterized protein YecA (UPF0149 family)